MILIFSLSRDQGTNGVVAWLDSLGEDVVRINGDEPGSPEILVDMGNGGFSFSVDGTTYRDTDISAIWYRKGIGWFPPNQLAPDFPGQPALSALLGRKLTAESKVAAQYFQWLMRDRGVRTLGNPLLGDPNKLIVLHQAQQLGLKVPSFSVINRLADTHRRDASRYVTKALSDGVYLWDHEGARRGYFTYTEALDEVLAASGPEAEIPLSLLQEKIPKSFEVRSFFLDGIFTTAAIYSQEDVQTAVDYRKYNEARPNRNVPMKLPKDVAGKLARLFGKLELNTGSVDMIVDEDGEFVFLEINPMGIYGGVAAICNFNIDQAIAKWLSGRGGDDCAFKDRDVGGASAKPASRLPDHLLQGAGGPGG